MISEIGTEGVSNLRPFIEKFFGHPVWGCPMLQTEEQMISHIDKIAAHPGDLLLAVYDDDLLTGVFSVVVEPENKYAEVVVALSEVPAAYEMFFSYIRENFAGYEMDFVINPRNDLIARQLRAHSAVFYGEERKFRLQKLLPYVHSCEIVPFATRHAESYCRIHEKDTYWTAERVMAASSLFKIYLALCDENVVGYIDITYSLKENEPYDLFVLPDYQNRGFGKALLYEAVKDLETVTALTDSQIAEKIMVDLGFVFTGESSLTCHLSVPSGGGKAPA